ncbi:MAG: hypothetical protein WC874_00540, partial [Candidatus Izemoplasmatales bacterium]
GTGFTGRKPNGNIQFVEASTAVKASFNLFEPLMVDSDNDRPLLDRLNPHSWNVASGYVEPSLKDVEIGRQFQFIRNGYFTVDYDSKSEALIFNRTVGLKSSFK